MKSYLTALFTIVPFVLFAQSNYHRGYVLKNNGDTLNGFINYREWRQNPKSIDFKVNKTDKEILRFTPQTVREFRLSGLETYIAYTGPISMNETSFSNLPEKLDTTLKSDTIFLKQLAKGNHLTLYKYTDEIKTRFFVAGTNGFPEELKYYEYYNNVHQIVDKPVFKGQLILYINKLNLQSPGLVNKLNQAHYEQTDLEQLVNEINNNKKAIGKKTPSRRFFAGISADRTVTEVSEIVIAGPQTDILHDHAAMTPRINFGIDFFDNPNVQRFDFRGEIALSYVKPHYGYQISRVDGTIANATYGFNQYTASVAPQLLYSIYNKEDFKVYLDAGIAFNFSSYSNNSFVIDGSGQNGAYDAKPYDLVPLWLSFPLQAGLILNRKLEVCLTYIGKAAYSRFDTFYASNRTVSLGAKFLFSKK